MEARNELPPGNLGDGTSARAARARALPCLLLNISRLAMLLSRTAAAFTFTAERLAKESPALFFWTFTFKNVPATDEHAMEDWAALMRRVEHHFPECQGVRVCELHRSHGIHFHCIVNVRLPIRKLQELMRGSGLLTGRNRYLDFGRMSVTKCDANTIDYLAKYLTKQYRRAHDFARRRRWGCIGGFKPTRCRDIEYDTIANRNRKSMFGAVKVPFDVMLMIGTYSDLWGEFADWPAKYKAAVWKNSRVNWMKQYQKPSV
jgi:hypothetical protein